jgi:XTP/dITP diphosphohydrolase
LPRSAASRACTRPTTPVATATAKTRDARNNEKLLRNLKDDRRALLHLRDGAGEGRAGSRAPRREGVWHGEIARAPRGANGFGYDPLFFIPSLGKTAAELDPEEKNRISHRGLALQKLVSLLHASGRR